MMHMNRLGLLLAALLVAQGGAIAASQKVFRCGPDGRIYSQTPCKDGYEVNTDDKRSAEQRKAAEDSVKREEKLTEKMTRERRGQGGRRCQAGRQHHRQPVGGQARSCLRHRPPQRRRSDRPRSPTQT